MSRGLFGPTSIAVNPVSYKIFVANRDSNSISIIDGDDQTAVTIGRVRWSFGFEDKKRIGSEQDYNKAIKILEDRKSMVIDSRLNAEEKRSICSIIDGRLKRYEAERTMLFSCNSHDLI